MLLVELVVLVGVLVVVASTEKSPSTFVIPDSLIANNLVTKNHKMAVVIDANLNIVLMLI